MSPNSLHRTLGRAKEGGKSYHKPARNCNLLAQIEAFVEKHSRDHLANIEATIKWAAGPIKRVLPWDMPDSEHWEEQPGKRARKHITKVGGQCIDTYLQTYIGLAQNPTGRAALYESILKASHARKAELSSHDWTEKSIYTRLKNAASKLSPDHWTNAM